MCLPLPAHKPTNGQQPQCRTQDWEERRFGDSAGNERSCQTFGTTTTDACAYDPDRSGNAPGAVYARREGATAFHVEADEAARKGDAATDNIQQKIPEEGVVIERRAERDEQRVAERPRLVDIAVEHLGVAEADVSGENRRDGGRIGDGCREVDIVGAGRCLSRGAVELRVVDLQACYGNRAGETTRVVHLLIFGVIEKTEGKGVPDPASGGCPKVTSA